MSIIPKIPVGTKSLLFGAHCWFIHPLFVWAAWHRLHGPVRDFRLLVAFLVHDWGYWGCTDMDGESGINHPYMGAGLMHGWFGGYRMDADTGRLSHHPDYYWWNLCLYHSRSLANTYHATPSKLCAADKLAFCLEPWWLYVPRVWLSGEVKEYMEVASATTTDIKVDTIRNWREGVKRHLMKWIEENK